MLNLFGIVHRDLHQGNILIDDAYVPRIIDFNLSVNARKNIDLHSILTSLAIDIAQISPDYTLINTITLGYQPDSSIHSTIFKKPIMKRVQAVLGIPLEKMELELLEFYKKSKSIQQTDMVAWFKTYWRTIDSWAVGMNIIIMIYNLSFQSDFQREWSIISPKFMPVIRGLCEISPLKRLDCVQALNMLDPNNYIIRKYAGPWLDKVGRV